MKRSKGSCAVIGLLCLLAACSGTDTGNPFDEPGELDGEEGTAGEVCEEIVSAVELDEATPLGFSANDVLAFAGGEHTVSLAWLEAENVSYGPESGRSEITIDVEPRGARFVDRAPKAASDDGPVIAVGTPLDGCRGSFEIDVRLSIDTAGGALAETVDTVLEASGPDIAGGQFSIDLAELMGSFQAEVQVPANAELIRTSLFLRMGFSEHGSVGTIDVSGEYRTLYGEAAGRFSRGFLAHFPAENFCGTDAFSVAADQEVHGLSRAAALEALNTDGPVSLVYGTGESSELNVAITSSDTEMCVSFGGNAPYGGEPGWTTIELAGDVALESADGRVAGSFPVTLTAQTRNGERRTSVRGAQSTEDVTEAESLPELFGVRDEIDFSGFEGGAVSFDTLVSTERTGGALVVNGLDIPECVSNPQPLPANATSSPPCEGIDSVPLWSASWGDPLF